MKDAEDGDLKGLEIAVVGGTGGIGRAISRLMASRGAGVTVVGRTLRDADVPGIKFLRADLSLMKEARRVAELLPAHGLDLLILTTGIFASPKRQETAEGVEMDMAVSFLSRLVIVREIAPLLGRERPAGRMKPRVFIMGYPGTGQVGNPEDLNAERAYRAWAVHMNTVAGNEMLVLDSARRYPSANFFGLNPGLMKTNIRSNLLGEASLRHRFMEWMIGLATPSTDAYARRIVPLLVSPDLETRSGALFNQKGLEIAPSAKLTDGHMKRFLAASEELASRSMKVR